ncbi:unnamed protein product [Caenorhabditis auriculariae]|uniref:Uncharacterized protein n=1 Tax=Caenorhabditis auriculariae TaxID=2777116 RepID=A0A8S1HRE2_9PELO|nr:unnamed protein product [Caenorhabditis auriculariae]
MAPISLIAYILCLILVISEVSSLTMYNLYDRMLEKDRSTRNSKFNSYAHPVAFKGDEVIIPRRFQSYDKVDDVMLDENGMAFALRRRPSIGMILSGMRGPHSGFLHGDLTYRR